MTAEVTAPLTQQETERVCTPDQLWTDDYACKVARADFSTAENYRQMNHDWRFRNSDELYLGWQAQKYWEGTRYPRSSLAVFTAFQQVESILPADVKATFGDADPFDCDPEPGTMPDEARAVKDLISWQLRTNANEAESIREVYRKARKSAYIYGNGVAEACWKHEDIEKYRFQAQFYPVTRSQFDPMRGFIKVPTGRWNRVVKRIPFKYQIDAPAIRYISLKDFYVDPNCPSPCVQKGRFVCHRSLMTIDDLLALADQEGFTIPKNRQELYQMATQKPLSIGDVTKTTQEAYRNVNWQPGIDTTVDAAGKRIEIIRYVTKDRIVWLANRNRVFYNQPNEYGFINFFSTCYVDVLDRWYALSICDIVEGDQRLQASLLNGRVDEIALALHPSTVKKRGINLPSYQLRRRPGLISEADNPKDDVIDRPVQNITVNAFTEAEAAERRTQKATGITDLAVLGSPSEGGNSANRTATGVNLQSHASSQRIQYGVENSEDMFMEPVLNAIHSMNKKFLNPNKLIEILGPEGQNIHLDPLDIMNADVKFRLHGSAKMGAKQGLMQAWPLMSQTLMNPAFLQMMATQQGKTINAEEVENILADMANYKPRQALFRDLTPQEQQSMNQPPAKDVLHKQMADDRLQAQGDHLETKGMIDTIKEITKQSLQHHLTPAEQPEAPEPPQRDSVSIPGDSPVGLEVLLNRGELNPSQVADLQPIVRAAAKPQPKQNATKP